MPQFALFGFPEKLTHKMQISLETLQTSLYSYAKKLEFDKKNECKIIIKSNQDFNEIQQLRVVYDMPLPYPKNRFEYKININRFPRNIQFETLRTLKVSEIIFEMVKEKNGNKVVVPVTNNRSYNIKITNPIWSFSQIVGPEKVIKNVIRAVTIFEKREQLFDHWKLRSIKPQVNSLINLSGPPGTGKTMIAHAIADFLKLPIIELSYAQIESKYVGDGPKNIRSVFELAMKENALLFFDEADSLLGRRIKNITEGSEQAINSMRSQMIIEMDKFSGISVFATNLIGNYDDSFRGRINSIIVPLPDKKGREELLLKFINSSDIPGADQLSKSDIEQLLYDTDGLSGRDLRDALVIAATEMLLDESLTLRYALEISLRDVFESRIKKGE